MMASYDSKLLKFVINVLLKLIKFCDYWYQPIQRQSYLSTILAMQEHWSKGVSLFNLPSKLGFI